MLLNDIVREAHRMQVLLGEHVFFGQVNEESNYFVTVEFAKLQVAEFNAFLASQQRVLKNRASELFGIVRFS